MKFKISEKSLFATLLRSPWWVSLLVMLLIALIAGALLPEAYKALGTLSAFPFLVIAIMAAWRQRNLMSKDQISELIDQARSMGWRDFSAAVESSFQKQGFKVTRLHEGAADFQMEKHGQITLVSAKRWKAASFGAEQLRELLLACKNEQASSCQCMCLGIFSPAARDLARQNATQLLGPADIAQLISNTKVVN
jgi:restriction system protein